MRKKFKSFKKFQYLILIAKSIGNPDEGVVTYIFETGEKRKY